MLMMYACIKMCPFTGMTSSVLKATRELVETGFLYMRGVEERGVRQQIMSFVDPFAKMTINRRMLGECFQVFIPLGMIC